MREQGGRHHNLSASYYSLYFWTSIDVTLLSSRFTSDDTHRFLGRNRSPITFFFSKTKLKPQFFSCTAPSPSKQGATRIVTRALCYPNTVFFSFKTEHLLHGREGPRKIPRRHYESNLCLFGSRLTLLAWCQVPGVNTPDTCERSATPKCINLPNKFSRPGTAKGSSRNQSSPSYQVKFFVPFSRRISSSVFPVVFEGRRGGGKHNRGLATWPPSNHLEDWLEPRLRQEGRHGTREERRYGAQSAFSNFHLDLPSAFSIWICTYEPLEYELVEHN